MTAPAANSPYAAKPWLQHYDFWVPATANYPRRSLYQVLMIAAANYRDRPATQFLGAQLTYGDIRRQADRLAASLHAAGIRKGDRVGIMLPNCPQYIISFWALMRLSAVVVNFNPLYTAREVEHQAKDSGIRMMITLDSIAPMILALKQDCGMDCVIATTLEEYSSFPERTPELPPGSVSFVDMIGQSPDVKLPPVEVDAENDLAVLQYTGGTTGRSKGAMLTHYNVFANMIQTSLWGGYFTRKGEERVLLIIPMYHIYGMNVGMILAAWNGTQLILLPKFDVDSLLNAFRDFKPTYFPGVPTLFISLLNHPRAMHSNLDQVRQFNSGSAPLPVEVIHQFEAMTGARLSEGYGLTEASPTTHSTPSLAKRKPGSVGLPFPDTECKIVDILTGDTEIPSGQEGELCIRGPQIMKGYWNRPEETRDTLRDGWLYTGDIARMDEDGFFYIVQRKKDMIIVSGFNVYPGEVEDVLFQHPAIQEAAVIGVPHSYRGEEPKAFVVLKPDAVLTAEELKAFCAERLAKFKVPTQIEFVPGLPKSAVGKVLRRSLRELEKEKTK